MSLMARTYLRSYFFFKLMQPNAYRDLSYVFNAVLKCANPSNAIEIQLEANKWRDMIRAAPRIAQSD